MLLKFNEDAPNLNVNFVKAILPMLGNVSEFEVFGFQDKTPFKDQENDERGYTFILKDDRENEVWLKTLCGYGGSGARATEEILNLLGLLDEFGITGDLNHIKVSKLNPKHEMHVVVSTHPINDWFHKTHHFWASMNFEFAYQLHKAKECLKSFGNLFPASSQRIEIPTFLEDANIACVDGLIISQSLQSLIPSQLKALIKGVGENFGGMVEIVNV